MNADDYYAYERLIADRNRLRATVQQLQLRNDQLEQALERHHRNILAATMGEPVRPQPAPDNSEGLAW